MRCGLDGVHMQQHPFVRPDAGGDLGDRLECADLVVTQHHGHERRSLGDGPLDVVGVDPAVAVDRQLHDLEAELLEVPERVADGVVLDGGGDDAMAVGLRRPGDPLEGEVVGLGATAREDKLARLCVQTGGHPLVRLVERGAGGAAEAVRGRRVAEVLGQVRQHRFETSGRTGVVAAWSR